MRITLAPFASLVLLVGSAGALGAQESGTLREAPTRQAWEGSWVGVLPGEAGGGERVVHLFLERDELGRVRGGMTVGLGRSVLIGTARESGEQLSARVDFGGEAAQEFVLERIGQDPAEPSWTLTLRDGDQLETCTLERSSSLASLVMPASVVLPDQVPAAARESRLEPAQQQAVEALLRAEYERQGAVGLSLALIVDGELADVRHRGWEDVERALPISDATSYRWASISKPLTAVAALQLYEQGRLDLDRDVRGYVPEFPDKGHAITCRQLLCHQGGIVHYTNGPVVRTEREYAEEHPFADAILALDRFKESPLVAEPGSRYAYTTHGYLLAAAAIQRAGEEAFASQVERRILQPLGMRSTQPDQPWIDIPHRTVGYLGTRIGLATLDPVEDVHWKLAGGGWTSTIEDLARFGQGLLAGALLEPETWELMCTSVAPGSGKDPGYGLGIGVRRFAGERVVNHSGSQSKTATYMLLCPARELGVFVMCNTRNTSPRNLAQRVAQYLLEG